MATAESVPSARVREILAQLVAERRELRRSTADAASLEANRLALVYWQSRLARSLREEADARPQRPVSDGPGGLAGPSLADRLAG